jgi:hypothetical protein
MPWGENFFEAPGYGTITDLSAKQFYAVKIDTSNALTVAAVSAVTDRPFGILQDNPLGASTARVAANVAIQGVCKAIAGTGGWTRGDRLGVDSGGALVTITEAIATNDNAYTIAMAIDSASSGDIARVLLFNPYLSNHQ